MKPTPRAFSKGFTLIELLIVIAIIGILASAVLISLSQARTKSRISANKAEVQQLVKLFEQEFSETGSYNNLIVNAWVPGTYTCNTIPVSGNHASEYRRVCNSVMNRLGSSSTTYNWLVGNGGDDGTFSIMIKASPAPNTSGEWYCIGSSGRIYEGPYDSGAPGCYYNP